MQDSMYSALFGALSNEHRMNSIANNLSNVNTSGYKRDTLAFKDTFISFAHDQIMEPIMNVRSKKLFPEPIHVAKPRLALSLTDFSQGSLKMTGAPLDVGISGEGFFKIQTPDGEFYSRNGKFNRTTEGQLVTEQGWPVLGEGGPITLLQGEVEINGTGQVYSGGQLVGQLQLVTVDNLSALEKRGRNLYQVRDGVNAQEQPVPAGTSVQQGFLEASNVNVVSEMVNMIEAQRQFEAYTKVMKTTDDVDRKAYQQVAKARI